MRPAARIFKAATSKESVFEPELLRKRLDVALVGAPNAGKSQLLNKLTGAPIAAVSRKRHTTRSDILGAKTLGCTQIVFKDTPGYLRIDDAKKERLNRDLISNAASEISNVDYSLLVVDSARKLTENYRHALIQLMLLALSSKGRPQLEDGNGKYDGIRENPSTHDEKNMWSPKFAIVLNKVDLVKPKSKLLDLAMEIGSMADACLLDRFQQHPETDNKGKVTADLDFGKMMDQSSPITFYTSALDGEGIEDLLDHLQEQATPCTEWAVRPDQATDRSIEEQVQELIREKIYRCLHREVPHSVQQINRLFRRVPEGVIIHQDLVVFTKSHRKLVLGSGGRTLRRIQESAIRDLQSLFKCDVVLQLHVKLNKSKQRSA